jgi:phosphoribosylaminoimidazole-succinocarboxamide synthase
MADPFRQEVYGEQARMWICSKCQKQRRVELKNKGKKADPLPEPAPKKEQTDKASKVKEAKLNEITEQLDRIEEELKKIRKAIREVA